MAKTLNKEQLLAIDLGGTKCALGVFDLHGEDSTPFFQDEYRCANYKNLDEILSLFLAKTDTLPAYTCVGVAGIVDGDNARMTNLDWQLNTNKLAGNFSLHRVKLINDLTALCAGIAGLHSPDLFVLQEGVKKNDGVIAVIAPGTGLGEGYLLENETIFFPQGSEGGHTNFSPVNEEQMALLQWMQRRHKVVSSEMVCAGPALTTLYNYLRYRGEKESEQVKKELLMVEDKTPVIVKNGLADPPCPLCVKTLELFLSILGSESGNLALKLYATKGVYIGGGILPRLVGRISFSSFRRHFNEKGEMRGLVEKIPVKVVMKKDAVLQGVASFGRRFFLQ